MHTRLARVYRIINICMQVGTWDRDSGDMGLQARYRDGSGCCGAGHCAHSHVHFHRMRSRSSRDQKPSALLDVSGDEGALLCVQLGDLRRLPACRMSSEQHRQ